MYDGGAPPEYSHDVIRYCYVYKYASCNAFSTHHLLASAERRLFEHREIRIACLGGGPGSDAIGALDYLKAQENIRKVEIDIWDLNEDWMATADTLIGNALHRSAPIEKEFRYMLFDARDPATWGGIDFGCYDLIISSYFLSEVGKRRLPQDIVRFWNKLLGEMKTGGLLGLIDNNNHSPEQIWSIVESHPRQYNVFSKATGILVYPEDEWSKMKRRYQDRFAHSPRRRLKVAGFLIEAH